MKSVGPTNWSSGFEGRRRVNGRFTFYEGPADDSIMDFSC